MRNANIWFLVAVTACTVGVRAQVLFEPIPPDSPHWERARLEVAARVAQPGSDFVELARQAARAEPADAQEAMFHLKVLMRAGMEDEAVVMLEHLIRLWPDLPRGQIGRMCRAAGQFAVPQVAWELANRFEYTIADVSVDRALLRHLELDGWSFEQIDAWLVERAAGGRAFWLLERLGFYHRHGRAEELIQELLGSIREQPEDVDMVLSILGILPRFTDAGREEPRDLSWLPDVLGPLLATQGRELGDALHRLKNWEAALTIYRGALGVPVTDQEVEAVSERSAILVTSESLQVTLDVLLREGMARCLLELGRTDEAQELMVEAADIREAHGRRIDLFFAGQTQLVSGARIIEGRVRAGEAESGDDPRYWLDRARYYQGRREPAEEEQALKKAVELTLVPPPDDRTAARLEAARRTALSNYARFLIRMDRRDEAYAMLLEELTERPLGDGPAFDAANAVRRHFGRYASPEDEAVWQWVSEQPQWHSIEKGLLRHMVRNAPAEERERHFARIEAMAQDGDPCRVLAAGWVIYGSRMRGVGSPERAVALWERALETAEDPDLRRDLARALFTGYLHLNDWRNAERILPERGTLVQLAEPLGRIAVVAAQRGDHEDAMRLWAAATNINPAHMCALPRLVEAGLQEELEAFYADLQRRLPTSNVPERALRRIQRG